MQSKKTKRILDLIFLTMLNLSDPICFHFTDWPWRCLHPTDLMEFNEDANMQCQENKEPGGDWNSRTEDAVEDGYEGCQQNGRWGKIKKQGSMELRKWSRESWDTCWRYPSPLQALVKALFLTNKQKLVGLGATNTILTHHTQRGKIVKHPRG